MTTTMVWGCSMFKITIDNEEVLCDKDITINEEMLNTSSVILNNVYPKTWEEDKDYVSRFYYPKDYSKCKIFEETYYPEEEGTTEEGTSLSIDYDTDRNYEYSFKGQISQSGTPTPSSPQPINVTTGRQVVSVCKKNLFNGIYPNIVNNTTKYISLYVGDGTFTMSSNVPLPSNDPYASLFFITGQATSGASTSGNGVYLNRPITISSTNGYVTIGYRIYGGINPEDYQTQVEKGNQATTYEEYKGNDYEINLGKNLLPNTATTQEITGITFTINDDKSITMSGTASANTFLNLNQNQQTYVEAGTTYTLSTTTNLPSGVQVILRKGATNGNLITISNGNNKNTATLTTSENAWAFIYVPNGTAITTPVTIYPQLEKGSKTSYSPYKTPIYLGEMRNTNNVVIAENYINKSNGKNLLPNNIETQTVSGITFTKNNDGSITINGTHTGSDIAYIDIYNSPTERLIKDTTKTYTYSLGVTNSNIKLIFGEYIRNTVRELQHDTPSMTFTPDESSSGQIFRIQIVRNATINNVVVYPQIEEGEETDYEPYGTGQWYIHKEIGKYTFTGSETWQLNGNIFYWLMSDRKPSTDTTQNIYCNKYYWTQNYASASSAQSMSNYQIATNNNGTSQNIFVRDTNYNSASAFKTWLSTHNVEVYYVLNTPTNTLIEDEELINQLNAIELLNGLNNINVSSPYLPSILRLHYNFREAYTTQDLYFCGIVKNTGNISLNPRYPHYCSVEVLDFKDFLSQGETLDFVINNKTIEEAIEQVINTIAPYGFIKGNVQISNSLSIINAYSTKDKTAYDVFNYIADITQSRWKTRMLDENTIAIDFYDPNLLPEGETIEYNQTWFENNLIDDISYSYTSNDYRNRQIMISNEVYGNISQVETKTSDGYLSQYNTEQKIGKVNSISVNGIEKTIATDTERQLGETADFYYTVGNNYFESDINLNPGDIISINYIPIVQGRQIINNIGEISRIETMTGRKGIIARYENRNDATTSTELQLIGQSYIKYKGVSEIKLIVATRKNIWNIGDRVQFNAPLQELTTEYMVKRKVTKRIKTIDTMFYEFELSSSFNMEQDINFFDNQRAKAKGNIADGEYISRNVDIENSGNIIFYGFSAEGVLINTDNTLNCVLNAPLVK